MVVLLLLGEHTHHLVLRLFKFLRSDTELLYHLVYLLQRVVRQAYTELLCAFQAEALVLLLAVLDSRDEYRGYIFLASAANHGVVLHFAVISFQLRSQKFSVRGLLFGKQPEHVERVSDEGYERQRERAGHDYRRRLYRYLK